MELKFESTSNNIDRSLSSNRTFMELKYRIHRAGKARHNGSNRTFMELKSMLSTSQMHPKPF